MRAFFFILYIISCFLVKSQYYILPNNFFFQQQADQAILNQDSFINNSHLPLNPFIGEQFHKPDTTNLFRFIKNDKALDLIFQKPLIRYSDEKEGVKLSINPILNFQDGNETGDTTIRAYTNTRGFIGSVKLKNVYIETMLAENQSIFPSYLYNYSKATLVVPGQGRWKVFKTSGFDYAFACGMVSIRANKHINITVGNGKQKIGSGYRSLLLSDNAFAYPYVKIEQLWLKGRLQYINTYAVLNNLSPASAQSPPGTEGLFQKKPFVYQYLNFAFTKQIYLGLFQGVIGEVSNDKNQWRGDAFYFNPVIFSHAAYYGLSNKNNVLLGSDIRFNLFKSLIVYLQYVLDDYSSQATTNKASYGYQVGMRWVKKIDQWRISVLMEYNDVRGNTYSSPKSATLGNESYSTVNQCLAYTPLLGREVLGMTMLQKRRWIFSAQYNYQEGNGAFLNYYKINFGFLINPSYNLVLNVGVQNRNYKYQVVNNISNYLYVQLQTSLYNIYYDF